MTRIPDEDKYILNSDLFQVIEHLFHTLGKGDILDIIDYFDRYSSGQIKIGDVMNDLNTRMRDNRNYLVKLQS